MQLHHLLHATDGFFFVSESRLENCHQRRRLGIFGSFAQMRFPHAKRLLKCSFRLNRIPFGPRKECFVADDPPFRSRGTEFLGDMVQSAFRFRVIAGKKRKPCVQIGNIAVRFEIWRKRFQGSASGCEIALHQLHVRQLHPKKVRL